MSSGEIPPWLQEQIARYEQLQATLQSVVTQKQQVEAELNEIKTALEELERAPSDTEIFKQAGTILIRSNKEEVKKELEEKKELAETRLNILTKQEERLKQNLQEVQSKIKEALSTPKKAS